MLRSMYSAVSGLRAHQFKMDVIGNNIANVNTVGFKKSQVSFAEVFSQTTRGASAPQGGRGGTNPQQVGLGVSVGSVRVVHGGSSSQRTDYALDFSVEGEGFFIVSGDSNFNNRYYTRAGNFDWDEDGTIVTAEGLKVLGYKVDSQGRITDQIGDLKVNKSETVPATTTKNVKVEGNLDSRKEIGYKHITDAKIYDSLGNPYDVKYQLEKTGDNTWSASITSIKESGKDAELLPVGTAGPPPTYTPILLSDIEFDINGKVVSAAAGAGASQAKDENGADILTKVNIGLTWGDLAAGAGPSEFGEGGTIAIDFSGLVQYGNDFTAIASKMDGNTSGVIDSFSIGPTGEIEAVFTNGDKKILGQIALAKFDNSGGLEKQGSNLFSYTRNSGEPKIGKAGGSGYGKVQSGTLEMSNVDLSYEFTEMITTQRGFQANSRVITTSDEILQELVNLKR